MPMGTWYVATLLAQQATGDADTFDWGIAPAPQLDATTTGTSKTPVTFGDPTGFGINAEHRQVKGQAAAKAFLTYAAGEKAAKALAEIGITPAPATPRSRDATSPLKGVPTDDCRSSPARRTTPSRRTRCRSNTAACPEHPE